jgi:4-amino-4-deoxy-L-arabinose transferase-like glycosyltransferase
VSTSWETTSAVSPSAAAPVGHASQGRPAAGGGLRSRIALRAIALRAPRPELLGLVALAGVLNLWALAGNGWANDYYSAAVRSMGSSWHSFLFASLDNGGVMTVDKPPLALWVQALSVKVFGYRQLSVLVPQALMGVASVALVYDLVRRRFGRVGGFLGGLALALTPIAVAMSRHNNPDALLVLCCVAALWCAVRGLEKGSTRWLVLAGVCVGLGFETKMAVAFAVVPGIALAWLWCTPGGRGRLHALRQLLAGGVAMVLVGGAWPALVELTPASERPWIAGTSDNSVLSLIFGYNGLGRVDGQAGGPGGGGGAMFGSTPGPLRLLNQALGGQAGWLLGFALVSGLAMLASSRLRRVDPRTGWLIAVGGSLLVTAVLFSAASGIFHPYYVSLLAPFVAAMVGAGAAQLLGGGTGPRIVGPLAVLAGVATELVVRGQYPGQLTWLPAPLIVVGALATVALAAFTARRARLVAVGSALAALLLAPAVWAFDTLGHATSGTFPAGGPTSIEGGGAGPGPFGVGRSRRLRPGATGLPQLFGARAGAGLADILGLPLIGPGGPAGAGSGGSPSGPRAGRFAGGPPSGLGAGGGRFGGDAEISRVLAYAEAHGGGTVAVSSQSSAAAAIIAGKLDVAGIGGFSGRESDVSVSWLAQEVSSGRIRWVLSDQSDGGFARPPGDNRTGSRKALAAVAKACRSVTLPAASKGAAGAASAGSLYDCRGRAGALAGAGAGASSS